MGKSKKSRSDDSSSESSSEASGPRTIELETFYWSYEETQDHQLKIHIGGKTHKGETVQLIVDDFQPYVYVELPKRNLGWTKGRCKLLFEYFQKVLKDDPPVSWEMLAKYRLRNKLPLKCVRMRFNTHSGAQKLASKCRYKGGLNIDGLGFFKPDTLKVHEGNIDPLIKLTAVKSLKLAGWIRVTETIQPGEEKLDLGDRKFSTADIDMHVKCVDIEAFTPTKLRIVRPKYISFDIECTSKNHNSRLPDPENPHNRIFSIANTIGHFGDPERRHQLFSLGNPKDIPNVEVIRCVDEKQLLLKWKASVEEEGEDCIIGYNSMKFDWHYMIKRAQDLGIYDKFSKMSRLIGKKAVLRETSWMSAAYGEQKFSYLDPEGITNVDVLLEIERSHKLSSYSLKNVSEHFLKENKDDVTPRQLFMTHDLTFRLGPMLEDLPSGKLPKQKRVELKKIVQAELQLRRCHGEILAWRKRMMACKTGHDFRETLRDGLTITGKYNVQDTVLPVQLCEKLNLWMTMKEMSNCTHVPMSYLHTRGQTVKVMAQVYRETIFNNIIIPFRAKTDEVKEKFEGAIVVDAVPGDHWNVACKDFESLYPSMMIAFNICYTTIIADDDPIPDEQCNVLIWESHIGCLAKGTPVSLSGRSEKIEKLTKSNVQVYGDDENGLSLFGQTNFFDQGVKECVALTFEDGTILKCTPDHRILTSSGKWVEAQDLEMGGCVQMSYRPPVFRVPKDYSIEVAGRVFKGQDAVEFAQLMGLACSDGTMVKGVTKIYTGHPLDNESVKSALKRLFDMDQEPKKENYGWSFKILGEVGDAMRKMPGIVMATKSKGRSFPSFVHSAPSGIKRAFLSGLFGGDGHTLAYSNAAHSFSPISFSWSAEEKSDLENIFEELSSLLKSVSFNPTLKYYGKETRLSIPASETLKFHEKINFAHCVHKSIRLEAGCLYLRHRQSVHNQKLESIEKCGQKRDIKPPGRNRMRDAYEETLAERKAIFNDHYGTPTKQSISEALVPTSIRSPIERFDYRYFPTHMEYMEKIGARSLFPDEGSKQVKYGVDIDSLVLPTFNVPLIYRESIGKLPTYDIEVEESHSFVANGVVVHNCEHDPRHRKKKAADVICKKYRYRFRKVVIHPDGTREHEGLMPKLVRNLLVSRKIVKKEMAPFVAKLKMVEGKAESQDIEFYKKMAWEIVEKGSLGVKELEILRVNIGVLDARQLALKVCANSVRPDTPIPCKVAGVFNYLSIDDLAKPGTWVLDSDGNEVAEPIDDLLVWSDVGFTEVKYVFRHPVGEEEKLKRVYTHQGIVDVTEDHSLLTPEGKEVTTKQLKMGDLLMHVPVPLLNLHFEETVEEVKSRFCGSNVLFSKVGAARICHLLKRAGEETNFLLHGDKVEICFGKGGSGHEILQIEDLVPVRGEYVYDIETKSHHFAAGLGDLIVHNSAYGVLGAQNGFAPLVEGASSVTAMGRRMITEAVRYIKEKYPGDPNDNDRGKAELVYGDTDSAMVKYKDLSTEESFEMGDRVCSETSHHLKCWTMGVADEVTVKEPETKVRYLLNKYPRNKLEGLSDADKILIHTYDANPINLQFENLYQRYFFLTMKRYVGHAVNRKGVVICKVKKGVVLSRRDNSGVLRNTYRDAVDGVLEVHSPQQIMWKLYDNIHKLFTRQIPDAELIIFMGVKTIQGYAKKKEVKKKDGSTDIAYLDINKEIITDVAGPLDPRLVYPNIPQVLLALKMLRRGDEVPPNTRLEFLYLKKAGWVHQGEKAEDYTFYRENKSDLALVPDYLHYLEKQLTKPLTELLTVYDPPKKILYEKIEDAFARCVEGLEEILKHEVKKLKNYERRVDPEFSSAYDSKVRVGYGAGKGICKDCFSSYPQACKAHVKLESQRLKDKKCSDPPRVYTYKKAVAAQIQYILDSALRKKLNPSAKREIDEKKYPELVAVCRKWKSRLILEKVYSQFADGTRGPKLKKRSAKRPTQTGEKLRVMVANENVKVMLTKKVSTYERGTMVTLRGITELEEGKKKEYFYDIELPNGKLVPKVERKMLATWYLKDGTIMKDILLARGSYAVVVDHLKSVFCPLLFAKEEITIFEVSEMQAEDDD